MYVGYFKDIDNRDYRVEIIPKGTENTTIELTLSDNPVTITQKSEGLFTEIKSSGCTIEVVTSEILNDLYSINNTDVEVYVYSGTTVIFNGYLTPYVYNQPYAKVYDVLQLEAVSKLSILKDIKYKTIGSTPDIQTFKDIIWHILIDGAGYNENTLKVIFNIGINKSLKDLKISEANFFDDDEEQTPWSMEEVLTEICRYLCISCSDYEGNIYFTDYLEITKSSSITQKYFSINIDATIYNSQSEKIYTKNDFVSDDSNISYDEIYNKVSVNVNGYNIEEISPDILDLKNSKNLSWYPTNQTWTHIEYDKKGNASTSTTFNQYHTYRLLKDTTNWKHKFFRMSDGYELSDYEYYNGSVYNSNNPYNHVNTRCAMIERFAYYDAKSVIPTSIDWNDYIVFFNVDDTITTNVTSNGKPSVVVGGYTKSNLDNCVQPVLEFTSNESLRYSPNSGTSYITFNSSLWYQTQNVENNTFTLIDTTNYTYVTTPLDGIYDKNDVRYKKVYMDWESSWMTDTVAYSPSRTSTDENYGKGWPLLKMKLQIGNKYWNGSIWTSSESTFYLNFNNSPQNQENEQVLMYSWLKTVSNHTFEDKINKDCYAIPITQSDNISGKLKLTIYNPQQINEMFKDVVSFIPWTDLFPVIFMKDFEMNYVYTDNTSWWLNDENEESDLVYTNMIYTGFNREYDENIECRINSYTDSVPISKSFVMVGDNNEFLTTILHPQTATTRLMEYHIIEKMLSHYSSKKLILDASVEYYSTCSNLNFKPYLRQKFNFQNVDTFKNEDGSLKSFIVDSYTFTPKTNSINIKFIEW